MKFSFNKRESDLEKLERELKRDQNCSDTTKSEPNVNIDFHISWLGICGVILVIAKLLGYISWSWWLVFIPFWIKLAIIVVAIGIWVVIKICYLSVLSLIYISICVLDLCHKIKRKFTYQLTKNE